MTNNRCDKYKEFFTKEYLMGPNSIRILDELLEKAEESITGGNVLDLGCGEALTSLFIANETKADRVYAMDLWISATDNYERIKKHGLEEKIIPIHADALEMPFAHEYFDAIITVDAYHYFGMQENVFAEKILPFVKKGATVLIGIPGYSRLPDEKECKLMEEWAEEDTKCFHTIKWWCDQIKKGCENEIEIEASEAKCFDKAWQEWITCGNEYGIRDEEFLQKGLDQLLNFALIKITRKNS